MSQPQPTFVPILGSQLGGAITVNIFSLLSTIALISVILRTTWLAIRRRWCKSLSDEAQESVFFHTQLGNYASCLIIALMFTTISGIIGFQWLFHRGVSEGWTCRFQALITQIGTFSTGYFTIAIAVHTFNSLVMKMRQSVVICRTTIVAGWVLAAIIAAVPFMIHLPEGYVYGADDLLTCGVRSVYPKLQFFLHLLPILLASVLGAVLYSLIFLVLRGTLKLKSGIKLTLDPNVRWNGSEGLGESYHRFIARVARSMLWYPVGKYKRHY
ncbi:hypothetical protein BDZ97DRAFT_448138 [Flammula alnicola]|nr:hypothetical protein BDZ97DRAFT_448138 [Flammula alnicola]